jgi:hypothetical protein
VNVFREIIAPTTIEPVWRTPSGANGPLALTATDSYIVASGSSGVTVLDARTGRVRWHRPSGLVSAVARPFLAVSDQHGGVESRELSNGAARWHVAHLCPAADGAYAVSFVYATTSDVFAGCTSGTLFRLDARSGRRLAVWNFDSAARFFDIRLLDRNTVAITLETDGALLVSHLVLLRRDDLEQLAADWQEDKILGVVGTTAIINVGCCYGRMDEPVSLFHYNLKSGAVSDPQDVARDADVALGNGSSAAIFGTHLYVSLAPTLADAGDPLVPSRHPRQLVGDLDAPAEFIVGGRAMVHVNARDGERYELLDLHTVPPRVLWRGRSEWVVSYDERSAPDTIVLVDSGPQHARTEFLRIADGNVLTTRDPCGYIATAPGFIIAQCGTNSKAFATIEAFAVPPSYVRPTTR